MGTYAHVITKNHATRLPGRVAFLNIQPIQEQNHANPKRIDCTFGRGQLTVATHAQGALHGRREFDLCSAQSLAVRILGGLASRQPLWLFGIDIHNSLTLGGVWELCQSGALKLETWVHEPPAGTFVFSHADKKIICCDLANYWNASDADYCQAVGLDSPRCPERGAGELELAEYARLLCLATERIFLRFMQFAIDNELGQWACAAGTTAWNAWRHKWMVEPVTVHACPLTTKLERSSYYGGRADCHVIGKVNEPVYAVDVNSLYPWIAANTQLPVEHISTGPYDLATVERFLQRGYGVIATCTIQDNDHDYPFRDKGKVKYARGQIRTALCGPEILGGIEARAITSIGIAAVYRVGSPLNSFVNYWYDRRRRYRQDGDACLAALSKGFLVSVIGKFAQKNLPWEEIPGHSPAVRWDSWLDVEAATGRMARYRYIRDVVECEGVPTEATDSMVALTSYVTSAGRVYLNTLKEICGDENIYYEDADCLHVNALGYERLAMAGSLDESALGGLRQQSYGANAEYWGVRDYRLGDRSVKSGIHSHAAEVKSGVWTSRVRVAQRGLFDPEHPASFSTTLQESRRGVSQYQGRLDAAGRVQPIVLFDA